MGPCSSEAASVLPNCLEHSWLRPTPFSNPHLGKHNDSKKKVNRDHTVRKQAAIALAAKEPERDWRAFQYRHWVPGVERQRAPRMLILGNSWSRDPRAYPQEQVLKCPLHTTPVPEPVPVVLDHLKTGTALACLQFQERQIHFKTRLPNSAKNTVKRIARIL